MHLLRYMSGMEVVLFEDRSSQKRAETAPAHKSDMPPPPVPSRAQQARPTWSTANAPPTRSSSRQVSVDLTVPRASTKDPTPLPSRKRAYSTFSVKTERDLSHTPSVKRERSEWSERDELSVTPRRTPLQFPPRAHLTPRVPYRHASSVSTVDLPRPRPRASRKATTATTETAATQPAPEDLRYALSQVHAKLESCGLLPEAETTRPTVAVLLERLYDRSHLDQPDRETEGWLTDLRSAMRQVLSMPRLGLVTSWPTAKLNMKGQAATKAPSTALLSRLIDVWKGKDLRRELIDVLEQDSRRPTLTEARELVYEVEGLQRALVRALWS